MKVSEITDSQICDYLKLDYATMTDAEKAQIAAIHKAAVEYVKHYTGHVEETVTGEELSTDDDYVFYTAYTPIVNGTLKVYVNEVEATEGFTVDYSDGTVEFDEEKTNVTADYFAGIDAFEDFPIAVYVLCQDMYDNRSMYVDNSNVNRVVETILGMHSINLL